MTVTFLHDVAANVQDDDEIVVTIGVGELETLLGVSIRDAKSGEISSLDVATTMVALSGDTAATEAEAAKLDSAAQTLRNVPGRGNSNAPGPGPGNGPP